MQINIIDAIDTLRDRFVPRFEVYVAKAPRGGAQRVSAAVLDPASATQRELKRLDDSVFKVTGAIGAPPRQGQLVPLAGPWGDKPGQRTDDILSVTFSEDVSSELLLGKVVVEVLNVYDTVRKFYRYTDIPPHLSADRAGAFPILDYGDALAVRFGYGSDLSWVFDGMITELDATFPVAGEATITVTAVDRRDRLRNRKVVPQGAFNQMSDAQIVATIAREVGLRVAAPPELASAPNSARTSGAAATARSNAPIASASAGFSLNANAGGFASASASGAAEAEVTTSGASASSSIQASARINSDAAPRREPEPHNNFKASDQDALTYITDRLKKASLELRCFGDTLFVLKPGDVAETALRYVYHRGLSSFNPRFAGQGRCTRVRVLSREPSSGQSFEVEVGSKELREEGLIPAQEDVLSVLEKIAAVGQAGDKIEIVTDYPAATRVEARRIALGILKRNIDQTLTASGAVIGDPRVRARTTLKIEGVGRFDGLYYVTTVEHRLDTSGYQTNFSVRRTTALAEAGSAAGGTLQAVTAQLVEGLGAIVRVVNS